MSLFLEALKASALPKEVREAQRAASEAASGLTADRLDRQRKLQESFDRVRREFGSALDRLRYK